MSRTSITPLTDNNENYRPCGLATLARCKATEYTRDTSTIEAFMALLVKEMRQLNRRRNARIRRLS